MVVSSNCAEPRLKKTDVRTQFAFLGRSAAGRRMTAEDELVQLSGSSHSVALFMTCSRRDKMTRANIGSKSAISLQRGPVDPKFQVEGVAPTNHSCSQKTRINDPSCGIKIWTGWLVADDPFTWNIRQPAPVGAKSPILNRYSLSASAVTPIEKSSINTNRKSTTGFPVSLRWSSYVAPKLPPRRGARFRKWRELCQLSDPRCRNAGLSHWSCCKSIVTLPRTFPAALTTCCLYSSAPEICTVIKQPSLTGPIVYFVLYLIDVLCMIMHCLRNSKWCT